MDTTPRRKILAGSRVRNLRSELGLSQSAMAGELGISLSYLNLIERNERPLTAQLLIKLSETYAIDPSSFAFEEEMRATAEMEEVFADALFRDVTVAKGDIRSLVENLPGMAEAVKRLYRNYVEVRAFQSGKAGPVSDVERNDMSQSVDDPVERVRSFLEQASNYFDKLETKAESILKDMGCEGGAPFDAMATRIQKQHGVRVQIVPIEDMRNASRHYDRHRRKLMISELLDASGRTFQTAFQLALLEANTEIEELAGKFGSPDSDAWKLGKVTLCNYFAAALMMPYQPFAEAADGLSYDLDILCARFGASYEQVAHRLTTMARPSQRRVPFFMVRVDTAGNISKRFSSGSFPFSRFGGTCARWNIHNAFRSPDRIERQLVEMPDGTKWLSISRMVQPRTTAWGEPGTQFVIGLGCELKYAPRLIYGKDIDLKTHAAIPIGINCRLCERPDCAQRAAPPMMRKMKFNENTRGNSPFQI